MACLLLARGHSDALLVRAALLHDVGKAGARIPVFARVVWVLAGRIAPPLRIWLAGRGEPWDSLARHAARGAARLRAGNVEPRLVALVAGRPLSGDEPRLLLLSQADDAV